MVKEMTAVLVDLSDPTRTILVGKLLPEEEKQELIEFLKQNIEIFAWTHEDMVEVDPTESIHHLSVKTNAKLVKQSRGDSHQKGIRSSMKKWTYYW